MPELPEVQAHAERLTEAFGGAVLERFTPIAFTALKTFAPDPAVTHGEALEGVGRRGKLLLLRFPSATHVVHLMQGGRLRPDEKQAAKAARTKHVRGNQGHGRIMFHERNDVNLCDFSCLCYQIFRFRRRPLPSLI